MALALTVWIPAEAHSAAAPGSAGRLLFFTKGSPYPHLPQAIDAIKTVAEGAGFQVDTTADADAFTYPNLVQYRAVVWLLTFGEILNADQRAAFQQYIRGGGGYVGIHSAGDTEGSWPWYRQLLGSWIEVNSPIQAARVNVTDHFHPSTAGLPSAWMRTDEWYSFEPNPRGDAHVLATVDESTFNGGVDGPDHPISWCQDFEGGRSWYTEMGDTAASFSEPLYLQHVLGGVRWAAGQAPGDCGATVWDNFEKVLLDDTTDEPFELDVAPDGRVFFIERTGRLKVYKPGVGDSSVVGTIPVFSGMEDGLLGLALDPHFAQNRWLYLYYAAAGDFPCALVDVGATSCGRSRLSRFRVDGSSLVLSSERILLEIPTQRHDGTHSAGSLDFDSSGNLYLSTGDNTSSWESDGYSPIDERVGRAPWDAQRTSANTNDLRGKLIRIHPEQDGTYTIPSGNLFPIGTPGTRPEIYAMGFRNPFRFAVDEERGWVYLADYGPDAATDNPARGPRAYQEWNLIKSAGNYGWPYCAGSNFAYIDYDFETGASGGPFSCDSPVNTSPYNTGLTLLPPARPATIWYSYTEQPPFPEMGAGCGCPMAGPAYRYDPGLASSRKFPAYYDDTPFFYEWGRNYFKEIKLHSGDVQEISPFLAGLGLRRPIDMTFGPDGAMYLLEWGEGIFGNTDSGLYRIDYLNNPPLPIGPRGPESTGGDAPGGGGKNAGPQLSCTAEPSSLRPNNHKLEKVTVDVEVTARRTRGADVVLESVSSNRPDSGLGRKDRPGDMRGWKIGTFDTQGRLRAEGRRRYTLKYEATDGQGRSDTCSPTITVGRGG